MLPSLALNPGEYHALPTLTGVYALWICASWLTCATAADRSSRARYGLKYFASPMF
jgi:hypothetical protein